MAVDTRLVSNSGRVQGPFGGVSVYAPFAMLMHVLREDVVDGGKFSELVTKNTRFQLEVVPDTSLVRLTKDGIESQWSNLYANLTYDEELDVAFKSLYELAWARAAIGRFDYDSELLRLTTEHVNKGFISEDDLAALNKALISEFADESSVFGPPNNFFSFCHLTVNRINRAYFETRPATDVQNDQFQRWYLWPYLGMMTLINRLSIGENEDTSASEFHIDNFLTEFTDAQLEKTFPFIKGDLIAAKTIRAIKQVAEDSLRFEPNELAEAYQFSSRYAIILDDFGSVGSRREYIAPFGDAEYKLFIVASLGQRDFISYVNRDKAILQPTQDAMDKIQSILSKAIFLDGQNRAQFVKSELGDFDDLSKAIGDEAAQLMFDILDGLEKDEQSRLSGEATPTPEKASAEPIVSDEEDVDLDIDDELDDLLEDLLDDEELEDLLDLDLEDL